MNEHKDMELIGKNLHPVCSFHKLIMHLYITLSLRYSYLFGNYMHCYIILGCMCITRIKFYSALNTVRVSLIPWSFPRFQRLNIWEWPGYEAKVSAYTIARYSP